MKKTAKIQRLLLAISLVSALAILNGGSSVFAQQARPTAVNPNAAKQNATGRPAVSSTTAAPKLPAPAQKSEQLALNAAAKPESPVQLDTTEYSLKSSRTVGSCDLVEVLLEVVGQVKQVTPELKEVSDKMEVVTGFRYEERVDTFSTNPANPLRSLRRYELARAKMNIGDTRKNPELENELKTVVCEVKDGDCILYSPSGLLRSEQMLLIEGLPGNTLVLDRLLPEKDVKIGDSWKIPEQTLMSFLYVDAIKTNETKAVLTAVTDDIALVEIVGSVEAVYLGALTELDVQVKYQFDLKSGRIVWLGVLLDQKRSIGHAAPGLEARARLQVKILPIEKPNVLSEAFVEKIRKSDSGEQNLKLRYEFDERPWSFQHARHWFIIVDDVKSTILRMVVDGDLVAQCQIQDMGTVAPGTMPSLKTFQSDLEKGLESSGAVTAFKEEAVHPNGTREYHVILDGEVKNIPLRWIYYLLTDTKGNQRVVVFVLEEGKMELFDEEDIAIIDSFRIHK